MTHQIVAIPMTLNDLQGHCKPFQMGFSIQLCSSWQDFNWYRSCGRFAI